MATLIWNESMSVKNDSIDNQHKKLFDLINNFYDNIRNSSNTELILKLIQGMKNYTVQHFNMEEQYMMKFAYPKLNEHKKEHIDFMLKVEALEAKIKNGTMVVSFEITNFLKDWIKNHILSSDKKYSDFILQKGA